MAKVLKMTNPMVTVAIVFYNAMPYFPSALRSCLRQTFEDFELLLIDDGSCDGSLEHAKEVELLDRRVRVYADGRNLKLNIRLNEAVKLARGRFFARMDADDIMMPWRLEHQLEMQRKYGECFLGGSAISIDLANNVRGYRSVRKRVSNIWQARHLFIHPTLFAPTALFKKYPYNESFLFHRSQDAELWIRVWDRVRCISDARPVIFYRESEAIGIENYLGTAFGLAAIAFRLQGVSSIGKLFWLGRVFANTWIVCAMVLFGKSRLLVGLRSSTISSADRLFFTRLIADIREVRL